MKRILLIASSCLLLVGCQPQAKWDEVEAAKQLRWHQESADEIVNKIIYIKDPRTGICYAYYWGGMANGGPALATVPLYGV